MLIPTWSADIDALQRVTHLRDTARTSAEQASYALKATGSWNTLWNKVLFAAEQEAYPHEVYALIRFVHQARQALQGLQPLQVQAYSPRHVEASGRLGPGQIKARIVHWRERQFAFEVELDYVCPPRWPSPETRKQPAFLVDFSPRRVLGLHRLDLDSSGQVNRVYATEFPPNVIYTEWLQLRLAMQRSLAEYGNCTR